MKLIELGCILLLLLSPPWEEGHRLLVASRRGDYRFRSSEGDYGVYSMVFIVVDIEEDSRARFN
jgi:hypothetical protein